MANRESYSLGPRLDIQQLHMEAQHRWLRPAEICEILRNYQKFHIASEPPNKPSSGSLFLFDRKVLRYFRKDGHNWRKKKDGKTVKEAHEKLKVGSVDVLHCYYAHGEDNENFQRRSYWMLEQDLMHIVFVHYLEVKSNKTSSRGVRENNEVISDLATARPLTFSANHSKAVSGITDSPSPTSTLTISCEDTDSGYDNEDSHKASSRSHSHFDSRQMINTPLRDKLGTDLNNLYPLHTGLDSYDIESSISEGHTSLIPRDRHTNDGDGTFIIGSQQTLGLGSWEEILANCSNGYDNVPSHAVTEVIPQSAVKLEYGSSQPVIPNWQIPLADNSVYLSKWNMGLPLNLEMAHSLDDELVQQRTNDACFQPAPEEELPVQNNFQVPLNEAEFQSRMAPTSVNQCHREGNMTSVFSVKQKLLDEEGGLEKADSFSRWISKELDEVDDLRMQSSSGISWTAVECSEVDDSTTLSPSLSNDQLFSIINFSPKWAYTDSEIEVVITGLFLKTHQEVAKCNWSCMFGEVEVPAEILVDGVLSCHAPPHTAGRVPFYVTCSNRFACSEVREFEYLVGSTKDADISDIYNAASSEMLLHLRLDGFLSERSLTSSCTFEGGCEKQNIINKIISLKDEEEGYRDIEPNSDEDLPQHVVKKKFLQKMVKEKLYAWLLHNLTEEGKGASVLDDEGQGILHLAAALGYDWAIKPTITAGVSINFRDINGWTALHWAAYYGREKTVAFLVSLGAAPGALTDPSPEFPLARTPSDLASGNGHKGISGFLAESSLTTHLSSLTMNDVPQVGAVDESRTRAVQTVSERTATPVTEGEVPDILSLKDSLAAVCNATQAAHRIHQVYRMQSFQRKQLTELADSDSSISDEHAFQLVAARKLRHVKGDVAAHTAAVQIQKKFRGWKKRKEFLLIRQRIIKIQAHVRGHQVRKQYRSITWSVGILEKVILRWRRKGSGLRGFRRDALSNNPNSECLPPKEDDYDVLKEGRRQTEERLQKALGRVKSMVQYPEGRAQYRRLLTVVENFRETKMSDMALGGCEEVADGDEDLIDIESILDDDTFMSIAFE